MNNLDLFRKKLADGKLCIGMAIDMSDPRVSEMIGELGYDWSFIDMEHSMLDLRAVEGHLMASRARETAPIIRVHSSDPVLMKRILDLYPAGIIVPQIRSAAEARRAIDASLYPPRGERGYGPIRGVRYGLESQEDYLANFDLFRVVQIEHTGAVAELDAILEIDALDGVIIGPNDLSGSMGKLGQTDDPEVVAVIDEVSKKVIDSGKYLGSSTGFSETGLKRWLDRGASFISLEGDIWNLCEASRKVLNAARVLGDA